MSPLVLARLLSIVVVQSSAPSSLRFTEEAAARGLVATNHCGDPVKKRYILETIGNGCALFDKDGDGDLDAFLVDSCALLPPETGDPLDHDWRPALDGQCRLFENDGHGRFTDVTESSGAGLRVFGCGVTAVDYDGDGDVDLFVTCWGDDHLLQNDGKGRFTDVTAKAKLSDPYWSIGSCFFDADGDGDLDVYVSNYVAMAIARDPKVWRKVDCPYFDILTICGPKGMVPEIDSFFVNDGDGTFHDASESSGIRDVQPSYGMGCTAFDEDLDGDVDVYVGNDSRANYLFENDGKGHFTDVADLAGVAVSRNGVGQASMGIACGDLDGNGLPDLVVTNFSHDDKEVYANQGGGNFLDVTSRMSFGPATYLALSWGTELADFDCDGDLDLFIANGHVYPEADRRAPELTYKQINRLYRNDGGILADATATAGPGFDRKASFRGVAIGDVDDDGDLDVLVMTQNEAPSLLINQLFGAANGGATNAGTDGATPRPHWLLLALEGAGKNRGAIGARVVAELGGKKQLRQVRAGASFASSHDPRLHFGLGTSPTLDRLTVTWPDGKTQTFEKLAADRVVILKEGGELVERSRP